MLQVSVPFDRDGVRRLIREQSDGLAARLDQLADADWHRATPCPGWEIAHVVAHLSSGAGVQIQTLQRGIAGDTSPLYRDPAERAKLTDAKLAMPESQRAADYRREMAALHDFFAGLTETDMACSAWHQSGVHPLPWFYIQRLGETTMHRGDVHAALGDAFEYPEDVAAQLLPLYVARLPRMALDATPALIRFGSAGSVRLGGAPEYLESSPEAPSLSLEGDAATLLRVVVGRLQPREALEAGRLRAEGDASLLPRWRELFRTL